MNTPDDIQEAPLNPVGEGSSLVEAIATAAHLTTEELALLKEKKPLSPFQLSLRAFYRDKRAMVSLGVLAFLVVISLIGPFIYQHIGGAVPADLGGTIGPDLYHSYGHTELSQQNLLPNGHYWLGTDNLGRDMLARLMQGLLVSLIVALLVEVFDVGIGSFVGVLAGYYGGWIDFALARVTDLIFAFPGLLFAILLTSIFNDATMDAMGSWPLIGSFMSSGNGPLVLVSLALSLVAWPLMARYVRGQTLQIKNQQFIEAARASGTSDTRIILSHIFPNLFSVVIIASSLNIAGTIIGEAGLSLLGLGVREPASSLGLMIFDGVGTIGIYPWNALLPTIVLTILVLAISFISDGLRDAMDPRSHH